MRVRKKAVPHLRVCARHPLTEAAFLEIGGCPLVPVLVTGVTGVPGDVGEGGVGDGDVGEGDVCCGGGVSIWDHCVRRNGYVWSLVPSPNHCPAQPQGIACVLIPPKKVSTKGPVMPE